MPNADGSHVAAVAGYYSRGASDAKAQQHTTYGGLGRSDDVHLTGAGRNLEQPGSVDGDFISVQLETRDPGAQTQRLPRQRPYPRLHQLAVAPTQGNLESAPCA